MRGMNLGAIAPSHELARIALFLVIPLLLVALWRAPWRALMAEQERMSALGAAILAGYGLGIYDDMAGTADALVARTDRFEPRPEARTPTLSLFTCHPPCSCRDLPVRVVEPYSAAKPKLAS